MKYQCNDVGFAFCSCNGCVRLCSCLMQSKLGLPCPIPQCGERIEAPKEEAPGGNDNAMAEQLRF